jgi:sugar phosphate permease
MNSAPATRAGSTAWEWRILALLIACSFVCLIDRSNFSVGATDIQRDLHLTNSQLGLLSSAFFFTYASFQPGPVSLTCGWLADRWILRGATPTLARKTFAGTGLALSAIILPVVLVRDERPAMLLLCVACVAFGIYTPTIFAMCMRTVTCW